MTPPWS